MGKGEPIMICYRIEFIVGDLTRQKLLRERERIVAFLLEGVAIFFRVIANEIIVEIHVVAYQVRAERKFIEVCNHFGDVGSADKVGIFNARERDNFGGQTFLTSNEGREFFHHAAVDEFDCSDFDNLISSDHLVLIDFYATWCAPCKKLGPSLLELSNKYKGQVDFYKVDTEKEERLAMAFNVSSVPTLMFIPKEGEPIAQGETGL